MPYTLADLGFELNPETGRYEWRRPDGELLAFVDMELVKAAGEDAVVRELIRMRRGI